MPATKRIVVFGASGFLGQAICKKAIGRNWDVIGISRRPPSSSLDSEIRDNVEWRQGDALDPQTYRDILGSSDAVIHSIGAIMEKTNYKGWINTGARGMPADSDEQQQQQQQQQQDTFEKVNRDTALAIINTLIEAGNRKPFVFISAAAALPLINPRYIHTKRQVEAAMAAHSDNIIPLVFRPGFMYSSARPLSLPLAAGLSAVSSIYKCTPLGRLTKGTSMEALSVPPLPRVTVAEAVIRAIEDPESAARHSPFEVADIVNIVEDHQFNTAP